MKTYREYYQHVAAEPHTADDLFRELGIEVYGYDGVKPTHTALLLHLAQRVKELEERLDAQV